MSIRSLWENEWESLQIFVVTAAAVRSPLFWSQTAEPEVFCVSRNVLLLLQARLGGLTKNCRGALQRDDNCLLKHRGTHASFISSKLEEWHGFSRFII